MKKLIIKYKILNNFDLKELDRAIENSIGLSAVAGGLNFMQVPNIGDLEFDISDFSEPLISDIIDLIIMELKTYKKLIGIDVNSIEGYDVIIYKKIY
jgi:hypothetical protein